MVMDEIWFHLSTQLEILQVETTLKLQQAHRAILSLLSQCYRYLQELYQEQRMQEVTDLVQRLIFLFRKGWEQFQYQCYSIHLGSKGLYRQLENIYSDGAYKRDAAVCLTGLIVGTLFGYYIGVRWNRPSHQMRMKAVVCHRYIGIEGVSTIDDAEIPMIQSSTDLLIQVKAASVNTIDAKICYGYSRFYRRLLNYGKDLPVILGRDCAGIVIDLGRSVTNFDIGDEVILALPSWKSGTMAEFLVVPESLVARKPRLLSFEASASLPYSGCLAWDALVNRSVIEEGNAKGRRALVLSGTSPVGCILIQLIKLWGGSVVAACKPHADIVPRALGADEIILLNESYVEKELQLFDKFDAIFYTGGCTIEERILKRYLMPNGSYVSTIPEHLTSDSLGFIFGSLFAGIVRIKLLTQYIFGFSTQRWKDGSKINSSCLQALSDLADADHLQAVVDRVYSPQNIEQALNHILDNDSIGSTIIKFQ